MTIDIKKEYRRFVDNFVYNSKLADRTEKPHLARWAYGACKEWIRDFTNLAGKTGNLDNYHYRQGLFIKDRVSLELKSTLQKKFPEDELIGALK